MNTMTIERPAAKEHAVVTIKYINEPKGNAVSGSIKDTNDEYWGVHKSALGQVRGQEGQAVEFDYTVSNGFRNVDVKSLHLIASNPPRSQGQRHAPASTQQRAAPVNTHVDPPQNEYWKPKPRSPEDSMQIWICTMLRADIEANRVDRGEDELTERASMWARIWVSTFGPAA